MARTNSRGMLAVLVLLCQLLLPFSTLPLQAGEIKSEEPTDAASSGKRETRGIASYYANRYNGRKTNSGVRYDPDKLTAAHPHFPLGTRVRVVNLVNGREVVVVVNDRCRKKKIPFIDLSRAAAKKLGFLGKGITKVKMIPLDEIDRS